jgi:hypothetical protein
MPEEGRRDLRPLRGKQSLQPDLHGWRAQSMRTRAMGPPTHRDGRGLHHQGTLITLLRRQSDEAAAHHLSLRVERGEGLGCCCCRAASLHSRGPGPSPAAIATFCWIKPPYLDLHGQGVDPLLVGAEVPGVCHPFQALSSPKRPGGENYWIRGYGHWPLARGFLPPQQQHAKRLCPPLRVCCILLIRRARACVCDAVSSSTYVWCQCANE